MNNNSYLLTTVPQADYYAFCDQDDVWQYNKLELCLNKIKEEEQRHPKTKPIIVHTDLEVVDENLNIISPSFWQYSNVNPSLSLSNIHYLAIYNCVTGCSMLFNNATRKILPPVPKKLYMHDGWISLVVMKNDGIIIPLSEKTVKYRQHSQNVCGADKYHFSLLEWKRHYTQLKNVYHNSQNLVFHSILHFLYWRIVSFIKLRLHKTH